MHQQIFVCDIECSDLSVSLVTCGKRSIINTVCDVKLCKSIKHALNGNKCSIKVITYRKLRYKFMSDNIEDISIVMCDLDVCKVIRSLHFSIDVSLEACDLGNHISDF